MAAPGKRAPPILPLSAILLFSHQSTQLTRYFHTADGFLPRPTRTHVLVQIIVAKESSRSLQNPVWVQTNSGSLRLLFVSRGKSGQVRHQGPDGP